MSTHTDTAAFDELVPDPQVCKELHISSMSVSALGSQPGTRRARLASSHLHQQAQVSLPPAIRTVQTRREDAR